MRIVEPGRFEKLSRIVHHRLGLRADVAGDVDVVAEITGHQTGQEHGVPRLDRVTVRIGGFRPALRMDDPALGSLRRRDHGDFDRRAEQQVGDDSRSRRRILRPEGAIRIVHRLEVAGRFQVHRHRDRLIERGSGGLEHGLRAFEDVARLRGDVAADERSLRVLGEHTGDVDQPAGDNGGAERTDRRGTGSNDLFLLHGGK